ncbi:MAG TPA: acetate/propionate family kinase, partial [Candidatus Methylacidiphilales bacterium]|nr:acetate/propionate family kinase [Candidatus Methylacidiphilales bacterium]
SDGLKKQLVDQSLDLPDHHRALHALLDWFPSAGLGGIGAIGHRIVQGGANHRRPQVVDPELIEELRALCPLDLPHLPAAVEALEAAQKLGKDIPQVACFDTSFHRNIPAVAQQLPLPRRVTEGTGVLRYGFHGLSYEYIVGELERVGSAGEARGKVIIAHLGNGASMTALRNGQSVETTMSFTPAAGLVMSSRTGDLDPGVLVYLLREGKVAPGELGKFIYEECGLKGVSDLSSDLRDLMQAQKDNPRAKLAVDLFHYQARKALGALVAVLDGVETLVFTAGIGENAPETRAAICEGLQHLGLRLDAAANGRSAAVISTPDSRVKVRVMKTNEEIIVARHTARLVFANP